MKAMTGRSQLRVCRLGYDHQLRELSFEGPRPVRHCKTQAQLNLDMILRPDSADRGQVWQGARWMKAEKCRARQCDTGDPGLPGETGRLQRGLAGAEPLPRTPSPGPL